MKDMEMNMAFARNLTPNYDVVQGSFDLPTLRRILPDGEYGEVIAPEDATTDELNAEFLEVMKFRRLVAEAIAERVYQRARVMDARVNGRAL